MKLAPLRTFAFLLLALCAIAPGPAAAAAKDSTEINLGTAPPPEPPADRAKVGAVERLLAARQAGSLDRGRASAARALLRTKERLDDARVFGPEGASLAAFNFHDESIAADGTGTFRVSVFLLFADGGGQVVESRDEELSFSHEGDVYVCTSLRATNVISWSQQGVREAAAALGATQELDQARRLLRDGGAGPETHSSYSLADISKAADGSIVVQCLRFRSDPGKRGFDVTTAPIVLSRAGDSIRIEPN